MEKELTTIAIKKTTAIKLWHWKKELDCKTIDEVIDRILNIVPGDEIEKTN
jgi:hypothetical protein